MMASTLTDSAQKYLRSFMRKCSSSGSTALLWRRLYILPNYFFNFNNPLRCMSDRFNGLDTIETFSTSAALLNVSY